MADHRIAGMFAWIAVDADGDEGLLASRSSEGWLPFVASDEIRMRQLEPQARVIGKEFGKTVRLIKFSVREELAVIHPSGKQD